VILAAAVVFGVTAAVGASLPGSNFEIDADANLTVEGVAPAIDWIGQSENRQTDTPSGANDDSYKGGSKEDDPCPATETGSIPNNKSDLLNFGALFESEANGPGYLHVFWRRVQDPSGTTLMDFEFNKSTTDCDGSGSGVNVVRTEGDILLEYTIDQGGAQASLTKREWTGSQWGPAVALTANQAIGDINNSPITAANGDGMGAMSARTFGEASFDLDAVFDEGECDSFGSAMLKSRSSDSFTSALKDFIRPIPVNIRNCGQVIVRKQTNPDGATQKFDFDKTFDTASDDDPDAFQLADGESASHSDVLFGSGLTVSEDTLPSGWEFVNVDCAASSGVTPQINGRVVTFGIDHQNDVLDCTFNNRALGSIKLVKNTVGGDGGPFAFTHSITGLSSSLTTSGGTANDTSDAIAAGSSYAISENLATLPAGWDFTSAECKLDGGNGASTGTVNVAAITGITVEGGKTTVCTFTNTKRGAIKLVKNTVGGDGGPFGFTHSIAGLSSSLTTSGGTADDTSDAIAPGSSYAISENVPPTGWAFTSAECKLDGGNGASTGTVSGRSITGITVQAGKTTVCTFTNTRLHKVIVIVCHEDTNTLIQSSVELVGGATKNSLSSSSTPTESQLCNLGGATFGGLGHGNQDLKVNVGSGSH
jgi:hypothetical protein